jgi:hypothetical protein
MTAEDWTRGWWWTWLRIGPSSAVIFGALMFGWRRESVGNAIANGVGFGILFGLTMTVLARRRWRVPGDLRRGERIAVASAVHSGTAIRDPRLAPAVIVYADVVRKQLGSLDEQQLFAGVFAIAGLAIAVGYAVNGDARPAVTWAAVCILYGTHLFRGPERRRATLTRVDEAEAAARAVASHVTA